MNATDARAVLDGTELTRADDGATVRLAHRDADAYRAIIGERTDPAVQRVDADAIATKVATQAWRAPGWGEDPLRVRRALETLTGRELVSDGDREIRTDGGTWRVRQTGLGDADAQGQSTLAGDIRPEGGDGDG